MFTDCILLVIKLPKLRVVVFRNTFRLKFNIHVFTRSSICKGVVLRFIILRKFTGFYRLIYYTSLRHLGG
jgi:hypothetical protein